MTAVLFINLGKFKIDTTLFIYSTTHIPICHLTQCNYTLSPSLRDRLPSLTAFSYHVSLISFKLEQFLNLYLLETSIFKNACP